MNMNRLLYRFAVLLSLILVTGCKQTDTASVQKPSQEEALRIGLIPEQNIFKQLERYRPLADYLSERIGRPIELKILTRYGNIIDNFVSVELDGAFFGSFTYALAHEKLGLQVLARPEGTDGSSTYHGLIFVRRESGIKSAAEMRSKRFVFVDKATTAGFLLPMAFFKKNGIADYKSYFEETYFAGTHEDAVYDVFHGKADIGAAKNTVFRRLARTESTINNELMVLVRSPDVPENALAVRKDLDESLKKRLKESLLQMKDDTLGKNVLEEFGARRFIETTDPDYQSVFDYAAEVGLDLCTYDYMNN